MNFFRKVTEKVIKTSDITLHFDEFIKEIDGIILESDLELKTIEKENSKILNKVKTLKSLGFSNAKIVSESSALQEEIEIKKKRLKEINENKHNIDKYALMFPGYKFVPEEVFISVLKKYNIFDTEAEYYIGDIPDKNIEAITNFKDNFSNIYLLIEHNSYSFYSVNIPMILDVGKLSDLRQDRFSLGRISTIGICENIRIAAPLSDFKVDKNFKIDTDNNSIFKNIKVEDPIVNIKVPGGRIIITAWDKKH